MNFSKFTSIELQLLLSWVIAMVTVVVWALGKKDRAAIFAPPLLLVVINLYYCLWGPVQGVLRGETIDRGINFRDDLALAWMASLVSFLVTVLVYRFSRPRPKPPRPNRKPFTATQAWRLGQRLNQVGLLLYLGVVGAGILDLINPFGLSSGVQAVYSGAFRNYLAYGINLLIPGITLMWVSWLQRRRNIIPLVGWLVLALGVYTSLGFRYRIALLAGALYILFYLVRRQRPKMVETVAFAALLIFVAGYIGTGRSYGRGLDLDAVETRTAGEIFDAGLGEATIFYTSAGILTITPEPYPHVGLTPVVNTLLFPVPRLLWPKKDSVGYLSGALATIYGSDTRASGAAFMGWAEWYLMGGWLGLVVISAIYGWLYRWLWEWFALRRTDPLACTFYVSAVSYQYVILSRGYMPQVAMLFCFTVLPLWLLYRSLQPRLKQRHRALPQLPL